MPNVIGFKAQDRYLVFDANSNLVFFVPKDVADIVNRLAAGEEEAKVAADYENGAEILAEINELKKDGRLFAEEMDLPELYGEPPYFIKSMCLNVSHDCDMRCGYCFASTGDFGGGRCLMSLETAKKAVDFLIANSGNREKLDVDFFGGEPLLNFDVVKQTVLYMYEEAKKHGKKFKLTVTTNTLALTDEMAEFFKEYGINLVLSLDGRKEVHDRVRRGRDGNGNHEIVVRNIHKLIEGRDDLSYFVRGTYTKNALDFSEDVKFMADEGFRNLSMEPVVLPEGHKLAMTFEDLPVIFEEYEKLTRLYEEYQKDPDKRFHFFHFVMDLEHGPCVHKRLSGCGAGSEYIAVTPEGDIYPCHQFVGEEKFKLGNIFTGIENEELRREFKCTHVYTKEKCRTCFAKFLCSGGCHANAYYQSGSIHEPYALGCEIQKKRLQCALYLAAKDLEAKKNG